MGVAHASMEVQTSFWSQVWITTCSQSTVEWQTVIQYTISTASAFVTIPHRSSEFCVRIGTYAFLLQLHTCISACLWGCLYKWDPCFRVVKMNKHKHK